MELSVELVLGFLGTVGALITLGSKAVEAYRARAEGDSKVMREALKLAKHTREDTGQHITRWADCEERCRELTERLGRLEQRHLDSEAENRVLRKRVAELEDEVSRLRAALPIRRTIEANRAARLKGEK